MRILLFLIIFFFYAHVSFGQKGAIFPLLEAESLFNKKVSLPNDIKGKLSLIGLAYSQKAEKALQTWLNPIYNQFIEKSEKPEIFDTSYDIYLYFIPMFTGANQSFAEPAKKRLTAQLDRELVPHVLIYKGEISLYKELLKMSNDEVPYIFILDEKGKIIYHTSGVYTEAKLLKLEELLDW